jgi:pyruvate dehydrogenase E1 component alpha subunit
MRAVALRAVEQARSGGGPSLVEAKTYRHGGHSRADPAKYRPAEEVEAWLARDPIPTYRERLIADGVPADALDEIEAEALATVDRATEEAKAGPPPDPASLETELWSDGGSAWRN